MPNPASAHADAMPTTGELLNPLALCSRAEDATRRELLMRGVLGHLSAWQLSPEVEADPDWEDVQALLVPHPPEVPAVRPAAKPGLWLYAAEQSTDLECGEFVEWAWPLGGSEQTVLGVVEVQEPLMIRVHRSFYVDAGRPVPAFLRAYDGLLLLKVGERRARILVQQVDSRALLEIAVFAYKRRAELRNPSAYVEALIRSLETGDTPKVASADLPDGDRGAEESASVVGSDVLGQAAPTSPRRRSAQ
ncbi:hypothetical protein [Deinococcus marmoris]|uniref:Uncharacterized protein n=1 Tax=Deinococcus marmoris TaxID=249408 RepID=A0A1U7NV29_9DEIO|nr:hypothetical protein [Deinococcus marmoris]OLV16769.1 hypothetical protein BOO71_0010825 [Deinococcus marmoris]